MIQTLNPNRFQLQNTSQIFFRGDKITTNKTARTEYDEFVSSSEKVCKNFAIKTE